MKRVPQVVDVGALNRRVLIQQQSTTQDSFGQPVQTWNTVYTCWASIANRNSQLIYATAEFLSKATHFITIRWTSSVVFTPNMRVVYVEAGTRVTHTYEIESLSNPDQMNRQLILLVYELGAAE